MKIIDLLNKMANNEKIPQKIRVDGHNYIYDNEWEEYLLINEINGNRYYLFDDFDTIHHLNKEIEVLDNE